MRNRFKGLDLIDRVPEELWTKVYKIVQETGIKTISMKKKCRKAKWLSEEALQIAVKRREASRDKKAFLSDHCKEREENNRMERPEISSRKLEIPREYFIQRWAQ